MDDILELARRNQEAARKIIGELDVMGAWESVGAEVHQVGSLRTGLLVKHLDMDFHVYTPELTAEAGFAAMGRLARNPGITHVEYTNLADTDEHCMEWHARYSAADGRLWTLDIINILKGSTYDGWFERYADRLSAVLTDETRRAVLAVKYGAPDDAPPHGAEVYMAVVRDGVRTYEQFAAWRQANPCDGIIDWMP